MMKKAYVTPELRPKRFQSEDILTASNVNLNDIVGVTDQDDKGYGYITHVDWGE